MENPLFSNLRESSYDQLFPFWPENQDFVSNENREGILIAIVKKLEEERLLRNEYLVVYSPKHYKASYFSKNVYDVLGYTGEELVNLKTFAFFNLASVSHLGFLFSLRKFSSDFRKLNKETGLSPKVTRGCYVGMKLKTRDGVQKTFMVINQIQFGENMELPAYNICSFIDITHLYARDFYWGLYRANNGTKSLTRFYSSTSRATNLQNFLTGQEMGILKLIYAGFDSNKIQDLLKISSESIEKYKKSMVKKSGAKDMTSLIHICKLCGFL